MSQPSIIFRQDLVPKISVLANTMITSLEEKVLRSPFLSEHREIWLERSAQDIQDNLNQGNRIITAFKNDKLVGYMLYDLYRLDHVQGYISNIYTIKVNPVVPVGKFLLQQLLTTKTEIESLKLNSISGAITKHKKNGFIPDPQGQEKEMIMPPEHVALWRNASSGIFPTFI